MGNGKLYHSILSSAGWIIIVGNAVEVTTKFRLEMLFKAPSTSEILQASKETNSFLNTGSDNEQIYKLGFYLWYIKLIFLIKSGRTPQLIENVSCVQMYFLLLMVTNTLQRKQSFNLETCF